LRCGMRFAELECASRGTLAECTEVEVEGDGVAFGEVTWMVAESEAKDSARNSN